MQTLIQNVDRRLIQITSPRCVYKFELRKLRFFCKSFANWKLAESIRFRLAESTILHKKNKNRSVCWQINRQSQQTSDDSRPKQSYSH